MVATTETEGIGRPYTELNRDERPYTEPTIRELADALVQVSDQTRRAVDQLTGEMRQLAGVVASIRAQYPNPETNGYWQHRVPVAGLDRWTTPTADDWKDLDNRVKNLERDRSGHLAKLAKQITACQDGVTWLTEQQDWLRAEHARWTGVRHEREAAVKAVRLGPNIGTIDDLGLSNRTHGRLTQAARGVYSWPAGADEPTWGPPRPQFLDIGALDVMDDDRLLSIRNFGKVSLRELREAIHAYVTRLAAAALTTPALGDAAVSAPTDDGAEAR